MTAFPLAALEELLRERAGLAGAALGRGALERAARAQMERRGLTSLQEYHHQLAVSPGDLQALIEAVVVPETWFFRHPPAFTALAEWARAEWLPRRSTEVLRVLSVPCSTGEEPYSIAVTLREAGLPGDSFVVDAFDISARALETAVEARYGARAFRTPDLGFRERHFVRTGAGYQLDDAIRRQVVFRQGNLLDPALPAWPPYPVVFCRNLLIYFEPAAQRQALGRVAEMVHLDGLLFLGPAETHLARDLGFSPLGRPMAFGFRRAPAPRTAPAPPRERRRSGSRSGPLRPAAPPPPPPRPAATAGQAPGRAAGLSSTPGFGEAEALADAGRLAEAAALCEAELRAHGPSTRGYHLLGLVTDVQGDAGRAAEFFRKALYLDPGHVESLLHLVLLAERQGDAREARRLQGRLTRARARGQDTGKHDE